MAPTAKASVALTPLIRARVNLRVAILGGARKRGAESPDPQWRISHISKADGNRKEPENLRMRQFKSNALVFVCAGSRVFRERGH